MPGDADDYIPLDDYVPSPHSPSRKFRIEDIKRITAAEFNVTVEVLSATPRGRSAPTLTRQARHAAIYLCYHYSPVSTAKDLGRYFNRDHSAMPESLNYVERKRVTDSQFAAQVAYLEAYLKEKQHPLSAMQDQPPVPSKTSTTPNLPKPPVAPRRRRRHTAPKA